MSVSRVLLDILVVLVAAKVAAELAERARLPAVVGEIVAGVVIGPSVFGLVRTTETLRVLGELGVILLLLEVGMQMDLRELSAVGRASSLVAVIGVAATTVLGLGAVAGFGHDFETSLFVGAAVAATSVGITARVFSDLRALGSVEARTVLGAAIADDVLGLIVLTVVARIITSGSLSVGSVFGVLAIAVAFIVASVASGGRIAPGLFDLVQRYSRGAGTMVAIALAFTLGFAELADAAQLAPIIGAFLAGLSLSSSRHAERIQRELTPVGHLFIPVFFLQIGIDAHVSALAHPSVLATAAALTAVAVGGKLLAASGATGSPGDKLLIGLGMIPRGEVALIFATIGLREHVLGRDLYATLLLVVLATTLVTPPLLRWRLDHLRAARARSRHPSTAPRDGRWLRLNDGTVELVGEPPEALALRIGLEAAQAVAGDARPGRHLLEYLGGVGDGGLHWDPAATKELFTVLLDGDTRTWRFLETSGMLERALPELAEAVRRRRADPFVLDPAHVLRFSLVDALRDLAAVDARAAVERARLEHPEWLLLAALILDTSGEDTSPIEVGRRLAQRLDLGAAAEQEIALLVGDSSLLRAAASRIDGLDEERVFALATHLDRPERARALYLLTLAVGGLEPWERTRLDELYDHVLALLHQPELTGLDARNLLERRRAEAERLAGSDRAVAERIAHAPRTYLLTQDTGDVARQAALLEPIPPRGRARVTVTDVGGGQLRVELACRDRRGLLATMSGVLTAHSLDVLDAVVATWADGAALESFRVRFDGVPPDAATLEAAVIEAFDRPLVSDANPDAMVDFDDDASPWYTLCQVRSPDRPGLLHAITVGLASAGADVHSARVDTVGDAAVDRFELTDRNGRKLDPDNERAIVQAIRGGVVSKRRRWRS